MATIEKIQNVDGQLMIRIPQAVIDSLQLTDQSSIEFCIGDALVTLWNAAHLKAEAQSIRNEPLQ